MSENFKKPKGGTRKIAEPGRLIPNDLFDGQPVCISREHNPPNMMVFSPGEYEHTCPECGNVINFTVAGKYC